MCIRATFAIFATFLYGEACQAQLRVVTYNVASIRNSSALSTVVNAINAEVVGGIAKPIDVLNLNEVTSSDIATILSILNGPRIGTYVAGNLGSTTGAGSVGIVYRTETVDLLAQEQVVDVSADGAARGVMRYTLQPNGYGGLTHPSANIYIYGSHYKASDTASDRNRRNAEAKAIRDSSDLLGNAHVIYTGDFNIYDSDEPMWATLTGSGNGQAFDPVNQIGNWHDNANFKRWHTQNPAGSGFVGGGMDDRFDWQMVTAELLDDEGLSMISGSYHAFGNNGTHSLNGHINTGTGASAAVLDALGSASDHLPIFAQYQVPARMDVAYSIPERVIVGATVTASATVSNSAGDGVVVVDLSGADELEYTVTGTGVANGSTSDMDAAFGGGNTHLFSLDTNSAGSKNGSIAAEATSHQAFNAQTINLFSIDVLDHANPSFSLETDINELMLDFGTVDLGSSPTLNFDVANLVSTVGFTSDLEFDAHAFSEDQDFFEVDLAPLESSVAAGMSRKLTAWMNADTVGSFSASLFLNFSDEGLPGASSLELMTLTLTGMVEMQAGDYNADGIVDAADYTIWRDSLASTTNLAADGNENSVIDIGDYDVWRANFGGTSGSGASANGAVPEPATLVLLIVGMVAFIVRRLAVP